MAIRVSNQKMNFVSNDGESGSMHCMSAQEIERLAGIRRGDVIRCTTGILWVTQEGDSQDYMLHPGEEFVANRHGVVVVEAMTNGACLFSQN